MQKARRHPITGLRPLVSTRFQVLFTPVFPVLFTFPSRYSFTIGLSGVCSLGGWCRRIQTGFLRSRPTQGSTRAYRNVTYRTLTVSGWLSHAIQLPLYGLMLWPYNPTVAVTTLVWAPPRSLATTWGIIVIFFSCGYLDVSVPRVCPYAHTSISPYASRKWVAPFGYLRITSYVPIPAAFRSLSRPSSPLRA